MMRLPFFGTLVPALSIATGVFAGGIAGGGGPPARPMDDGVEFTTSRIAIVKFVDDVELPSEVTLRLDPIGDAAPAGRICIRLINRQGVSRSYRIYDGTELATVRLLDRRALMRASLQATP